MSRNSVQCKILLLSIVGLCLITPRVSHAIDLNIIDWDEVYDSTEWSWRASLSGSLSANFPFGGYYTYANGGPGFDIAFVAPTSRANGIRIELGYAALESVRRVESGATSRIQASVYRGSMAFQVHQVKDELRSGVNMFRTFAGIGVMVTRWRITGANAANSNISLRAGPAERKLLLTLGGGCSRLITSNMAIDIAPVLDVVIVGDTTDDTALSQSLDASSGFILSLRGSLVLFF